MTFGEKLSKLRREAEHTQEDLAELLGVSRQAVSKWESDQSYPETEKLIRLGQLYHCSMDYLLQEEAAPSPEAGERLLPTRFYFERKSKKTVGGLPLWHVNVGLNRTARGVIAIGLRAKGIVAIGVAAMGLFSFGLASVGLLSFGAFAVGLLAAGSIACGVVALGAICIGLVAIGALAVGHFAVGALAVGKYFAMGDHAYAMIALGNTKAVGSLFQKLGALTTEEIRTVKALLDESVPAWLSWAKEIVKVLIS